MTSTIEETLLWGFRRGWKFFEQAYFNATPVLLILLFQYSSQVPPQKRTEKLKGEGETEGGILRKMSCFCEILKKISQKEGGEGPSPPPPVRLCPPWRARVQEMTKSICRCFRPFLRPGPGGGGHRSDTGKMPEAADIRHSPDNQRICLADGECPADLQRISRLGCSFVARHF